MKLSSAVILGGMLLLLYGAGSRAQEVPPQPSQAAKLADLLAEAERNNPQIQAARHNWQAIQQTPSQASTLPDPQFVLQHLSVGSPRPFAGYTNSDFAYFGLGFSQDIPYPGKLRLRGDVARKDAEIAQQQYESVRRAVLTEMKTAYFEAAYLSKRRAILEDDRQLLQQVEQAAEARYRSGLGNQQELMQSQLQQTKLLREIAENELERGRTEAALKQLLSRPQSSADIEATDLSETGMTQSYDELLSAARARNPEMAGAQKAVEKQGLQVDLAKRDFYPDFNLQYMWQRTDPTQFRAYYMVAFGVRIPIYRKRKQQPELAQAEADQNRARSEFDMQSQHVAFELRLQYLDAEKSEELLKVYREGLLPQARAELQAGLASYQSNRLDFQALMNSFLDVLKLDEEYWQTLSQHETALAQIEGITGLSLR